MVHLLPPSKYMIEYAAKTEISASGLDKNLLTFVFSLYGDFSLKMFLLFT